MYLKLNLSKLSFIYLSKSKPLTSFLTLSTIFSDFTIQPSFTTRSLRFLFDSSLFQTLNSFCCLPMFYHLCCIRQISFYLDDASLEIFVCSLIFSLLTTAIFYTMIFLNLFSTLLLKFKLCCTPGLSYSHISPSLIDLHWLPLHFRFPFKICSLMHKISHSNTPFFLFYLILLRRAGLRSSTRSELFIVSPSHSYAKSAFSFSRFNSEFCFLNLDVFF